MCGQIAVTLDCWMAPSWVCGKEISPGKVAVGAYNVAMDRSRWKIIAGIFHAALEISVSERREFVLRASAGDTALQEEVESLLKADAAADDYIESPLIESGIFRSLLQTAAPTVAPGDTLCRRFRIIRSVGEGGMGHVFEAHDSELAVQVALKTIRPEIATNPEVLARFRQEVRLARRITHPNVCRTFDLERHTKAGDPSKGVPDEIVFLTMEFLEGESLATRIKREGALPLDLALNIARQVASGLEAAQMLGVVHRDIKPGNIMLVPSVSGIRAVITDFGLAHVDSVGTSRTSSGIDTTATPRGTLAYMAPEQLEGRAVSPATDTYAFGLVLFEMVTGTQAFPPNTMLSGITRRLTGQAPQVSDIVPEIPEYWTRAISACLQLTPEDRPSAGETVAALENRTSLEVFAGRRARTWQAFRSWFTPAHLGLATAALAIAMSLSWAGIRYFGLSANSEVLPGALVYLAPVQNKTGENALDNTIELIRAGLSQSVRINLLDQARVGDTLQRMTKPPDTVINQPIAREIAMRNGAVRVVFTNIGRSGGKYYLDVVIQQPDSIPGRYRKQWEKSFEWQSPMIKRNDATIPSDLLTAARDASDWIRRQIGESRNDLARLDSPPEDVTTGNWEALAAYEQALRLEAGGQHDKAVEFLRDSVTLDPNFSLAYARLGDILVSIGRQREGFDAYTKALNTDALNRLTRRERDRIKGIFASDTEDYETAEVAFRDYSTYYESDYLAWFYQGFPLRMMGRDEESLYVLRRALAVAPDSLASKANVVDQLIVVGKFDEARDRIAKLENEGQLIEASWREGDIAFLSGDYTGAETKYRLLANSSDRKLRVTSVRMLARFAAERGDLERAMEILRSGIDDDLAHGDNAERASKLLDIAYLQIKRGDPLPALQTVGLAMAIDNGPESFVRASAILGQAYQRAPAAGRGVIRTALVDLQRRFAGPDYGVVTQLARIRLRAETLLAEGRFGQAITEFLKADALQAPADEREYLGRAYLAAASEEPHKSHYADWMAKACNAYGKIATRPRFAWIEALHFPPGFLGDEISSFLHAAIRVHRSDREVTEALVIFSKMRPTELKNDPELMRAAATFNLALPKPLSKYGG